MSIMIRPRPSAFPRYFVKPVYLQNVKPQLQSKTPQEIANIIGKTPKVIKVQKRNYAAFTPRKPDNEPPFWLLAIMGTFAASYSLKKKN